MGHNNFFDLKRMPEIVEGMKVGDSKIECGDVCEFNKPKKQPVSKDCMGKANQSFGQCAYSCLSKIFS